MADITITDEQRHQCEKVDAYLLRVHDVLGQALRIPSKPWPDPGAHGHEATAKAIHASFCELRFKVMDAIAALTAARAAVTAEVSALAAAQPAVQAEQAEPGQVLTDHEMPPLPEPRICELTPLDKPTAFTADQMRSRDRAIEAAVLRKQAQQVVAWQYRWTNPGEKEHLHPGDTDWKWVEHPHWQPLESKLAELLDYRYKDKPCYEVRALGVIAAPLARQGKEGA